MKTDKGKSASRYSGLKVIFATTVLLAPLVAKSALTIILKIWSKKKNRGTKGRKK
jgi:hypothetical protein